MKEALLKIASDDKLLLTLITVTFAAIYTTFSYLRFVDFYTANWDLGINQQMLWTTTHGFLLFETGDFVRSGFMSFLQIHSTYISLPIALLYSLTPDARLLFLLQGIVTSIGSVPLYFIAQRFGLSRRMSYISILVYLMSFPLISGILFDFHWETFIPVEFFSMFFLISTKRLRLSLIPFVAGCATLEVFPFLAASAALYFAYEWWVSKSDSSSKGLAKAESSFIFGMLILSVLAYVIIREVQLDLIPAALGMTSAPHSLQTNTASVFVLRFTISTIEASLIYWALIYISLALIPFWSLRHLILCAPWFIATLFFYPQFSSSYGNQYSIIALTTISIGFLAGLKNMQTRLSEENSSQLTPAVILSVMVFLVLFSIVDSNSRIFLSQNNTLRSSLIMVFLLPIVIAVFAANLLKETLNSWSGKKCHLIRRKLMKINRYVLTLVVVSSMAFSIVLSPLNQGNFKATSQPGYLFTFSSNPEFKYAKQMSQLVTHGSTVLVSNNLFPLVANNPETYSLPWYSFSLTHWSNFPFNVTNLPHFVFVNSLAFTNLPQFIKEVIFNVSYYGLRAFSYFTSYPGSIYLFQLHFKGMSQVFTVSKIPKEYYFGASNLTIGLSGTVVRNDSSMFGDVITSLPALNLSGNGHAIWYGPYYTFLPGKYKVTVSLMGGAYPHHQTGNVSVLYMDANSYGTSYYYSVTLNSGVLSDKTWTNYTYNISINEPYPDTEFRGYLDYMNNTANGYVYLNFVEVQWVAPQ